MTALVLTIVILLSLAVSAFCSGAETGFLSVRRERVLHMAREGGRLAKIVQKAIADLSRTTTALLVGNNFVAVTYSSASAALSELVFPDAATGRACWSVAAACLMLLVGEFLPKLLCAARPLRRLLALAPFWRIFARVFVPVASVVTHVVDRFLPKREPKAKVTPEAVLRILEDRKDGVKLTDFESALIGRIMVLRKKGESVVPDTLLPAIDDAMV